MFLLGAYVDTLIWLTVLNNDTVDGIHSMIRSVKALERKESLPCTHYATSEYVKQYSSKD